MSTTADLIAEARRALDESRISPMRSFDDDKDFALAQWSRNNLPRLVDALSESERRREALALRLEDAAKALDYAGSGGPMAGSRISAEIAHAAAQEALRGAER